MTDPSTDSQTQNQVSDKELNFRRQEAMYQQKLEQEQQEKLKLQRELQEERQRKVLEQEEEDPEPYVDHKKLKKTLNNFGQNTQSEIQKGMTSAKEQAKDEIRQELWLEQNPDFEEVLKNHANKLANKPIARTILTMPDTFERKQLVFQMIKELGLDKPAEQKPSIQDKIDSNLRSPFYQPTGVGTAPYSSQGDFSPKGQKEGYDKMLELKNRLRI